jgi:hypothetical protein
VAYKIISVYFSPINRERLSVLCFKKKGKGEERGKKGGEGGGKEALPSLSCPSSMN